MASRFHEQVNQQLTATQEDLQVMVAYAKALLDENKALHKLLKSVVIPLEEDLEALNYLSEVSRTFPILKTGVVLSTSEQEQKINGKKLLLDQLSPRVASRMSFWPEAVSNADEDLKMVLKEKMELKEEVMCLMDEVEVLKLALKKAGNELNLLKSERVNNEDMNKVKPVIHEEEIKERVSQGVNEERMNNEGTNKVKSVAREEEIKERVCQERVDKGRINNEERVNQMLVPTPSILTDDPRVPTIFVSNIQPTDNPPSLAGTELPLMLDPRDMRRSTPAVSSRPVSTASTCVETTPSEATPIKGISSGLHAVRTASYKQSNRQSIDAQGFITAVSIVDYKPQEIQGCIYVIHVTWADGNVYELYRRYGEFFTFYNTMEHLLEADPTKSKPQLPLPVMSSPGCSEMSVKAHLNAISTFCEVVALQMDFVVSRSPHVTDFFKAYPRDKNMGRISTTSPGLLPQSSTDAGHVATKDEDTEPSILLPAANGGAANGGMTSFTVHVATENYVANGNKEVTLTKGDLVTVIEKCEDGWWLVHKDVMIGWAPSTYLEPSSTQIENKPSLSLASGLAQGLLRRPPSSDYIAEQPYTAVFSDELTFDKDAVIHVLAKSLNGWWQANYDGKVGLVPASLLVKKLGKKVPRRTCVTLRSNFGHSISGISGPPPRRSESRGSDLSSE